MSVSKLTARQQLE